MDITPALDSFDLHPELKNGTKKEDSTKKRIRKKQKNKITEKQNNLRGE